jgi:hypothetical protein
MYEIIEDDTSNAVNQAANRLSFPNQEKRQCCGLLAGIKLRAGKLQDFVSLMNSLTPVVGKHGWKLLGSYASVVGRLNTVGDLWELSNEAAIQAAISDSEMAKYASRIGEIIEDETLTLLNKLPIS